MDGRERWFRPLSETVGAGFLPASYRKPTVGKEFRCALLILVLAAFALPLLGGHSSAEISGSYSWDKPPEKYGTMFLSRKCVSAGREEVRFTHWTHRMLFACRICHFELGFPMGANEFDITMDQNHSGKFCGFCHNGKEVFGTTDEDCQKCHSGEGEYDYGEKADRLSWLPESPFGNKVDWNSALEDGDIHPIFCLTKETCKIFDMNPPSEIEIESGDDNVPPAFFPHARHGFWLDCLNCHPGNVNSRAGKPRLSDQSKYRREFCKGCHTRIAFPMNNCTGCHLEMEIDW